MAVWITSFLSCFFTSAWKELNEFLLVCGSFFSAVGGHYCLVYFTPTLDLFLHGSSNLNLKSQLKITFQLLPVVYCTSVIVPIDCPTVVVSRYPRSHVCDLPQLRIYYVTVSITRRTAPTRIIHQGCSVASYADLLACTSRRVIRNGLHN